MGEQKVSLVKGARQMQKFVRSLLKDVRSLEYMLENDWFDNDVTRIGAEQEMVLVDKESFKPAPIAMQALESMSEYPWVETELATFNLETNLEPRVFEGKCFSLLQEENSYKLNKIQEKLDEHNVSLVLTGILPTFRKYHLSMDYLTPKKRYFALMDAINSQLIGPSYQLKLDGIDEVSLKHDSPMLEACNTSFQVHLQVSSKEFVKKYNIAQAVTGPIIAIAANSPIVFGKRLWHESRIAMFQQALDTRSSHDHMRERMPRVSFGDDWLKDSVLEIYKEDISRFRVLISSDVEEDSQAMIEKGEVPKLRALQVHNSTVYRWNRPCYGISDNGKPHLRIECRVIPSGPTVTDEVANACFWLGLVEGLALEVDEISEHIQFADISDNFKKASKYGLDSKFTWFDDKKISARDLILQELIPIARKGLHAMKVDPTDIDKYLSVIQSRAENHMTGARWMLRSFTDLKGKTYTDEALSILTATIIENQISGKLVHDWKIPKANMLANYKPSHLLVSEFMETDVFTVHENDLLEFAAAMLEWKAKQAIAIEDAKGQFVGLINSKRVLKHLVAKKGRKTLLVKDVMDTNPDIISEKDNIHDALKKLRKSDYDCLPVLRGGELVGLVTEQLMLKLSSRIIERLEEESGE